MSGFVPEYGIQKVMIDRSGERLVWLYWETVKGKKWWSVKLSDVTNDVFISEYAEFLFSLLDEQHDKGMVHYVNDLEDAFPDEFEERHLIVFIEVQCFLLCFVL